MRAGPAVDRRPGVLVGQIFLQNPFFAGIMGILIGTGLVFTLTLLPCDG